jgi:hypothetical protein
MSRYIYIGVNMDQRGYFNFKLTFIHQLCLEQYNFIFVFAISIKQYNFIFIFAISIEQNNLHGQAVFVVEASKYVHGLTHLILRSERFHRIKRRIGTIYKGLINY